MHEEDDLDERFPIWEGNQFAIILREVGSDRIGVIKALRATTTQSLMTIRHIVEHAPRTVFEGATRQEAMKIKKKLVAAGATVDVRNLGGIPPL